MASIKFGIAALSTAALLAYRSLKRKVRACSVATVRGGLRPLTAAALCDMARCARSRRPLPSSARPTTRMSPSPSRKCRVMHMCHGSGKPPKLCVPFVIAVSRLVCISRPPMRPRLITAAGCHRYWAMCGLGAYATLRVVGIVWHGCCVCSSC